MKRFSLNGFVSSALLLTLFAGCAPSEKPISHTVPQAWLPNAPVDAEPLPGETKQLADEVEQTFNAVAASLQSVPVPAAVTPTVAPWSLSKMTFHLGVGASGIFGVLFGDGDGAVEIAWGRKVSPKAVAVPAPKAKEESQKISVPSDASVESLEAQVEPFVKAALASREVQNETALRRSLRLQLLRFKDMIVILSRLPANQRRWALDSLELALVFSASGEIPAGPGIKAALTIALHWDLAPSEAALTPKPEVVTEFGKNLEEKLQRITTDLSSVLDRAIAQVNSEDSVFELKEITLNLGFSKSGDVGIASVLGDLTGAFTYKMNDRNGMAYAALPREVPILIATPASRYSGPRKKWPERKSVYAPSVTFEKGLRKAFKTARFFADRAESISSGSWEVKSVLTDFSVTRTAQLGLTTVDATSGVSLRFKRKGKPSIASVIPAIPQQVPFSPFIRAKEATKFHGVEPQISSSLSDYLANEASNPAVLNAVACEEAPKSGWNLSWVLLGIKSQVAFSAFEVAKVSVAPKIQWIWEPITH